MGRLRVMVLDNLISWDSYSNHMKMSLHKMMMTEQFTDVTLVSAEQTKIKAHRNILGACSEAFKNIFHDLDVHTSTVIYLKGIKDQELRYILEYMYKGEVKINLERLGNFLNIAKELEISELHNDDIHYNTTENIDEREAKPIADGSEEKLLTEHYPVKFPQIEQEVPLTSE